MANGRVKVGIIGSQFQADIHAASLQIMPDEAEVVAVASPTPGNAAAFARKFNIPRVFTDYREMLKEKDIEMVTIAAPNSLHAQMTKDCAAAGKHIVCEKPLAMTIAEGEEMIAVAKRHGVLLMYGEELSSRRNTSRRKKWPMPAPSEKSIWSSKAKNISARTANGSGTSTAPAAARSWTWAATASPSATGSWAGPPSRSIYCQMGTYVHGDKTQGEDDSLCIMEFANGAVALIENSWARRGGMDDRIEVYGDGGVTYANLHMGNALPTYSEYGYGYAVEKAPTTKGWTYPVFEELWNYGTPQELTHFARCVRGKETPQSRAKTDWSSCTLSTRIRLRWRRKKNRASLPGSGR